MAARGRYVHVHGKIFGGIPKMLVLCNFLKILMFSDKMIHRAFRTHTTHLKRILIFTIYQNYTLALIVFIFWRG